VKAALGRLFAAKHPGAADHHHVAVPDNRNVPPIAAIRALIACERQARVGLEIAQCAGCQNISALVYWS